MLCMYVMVDVQNGQELISQIIVKKSCFYNFVEILIITIKTLFYCTVVPFFF